MKRLVLFLLTFISILSVYSQSNDFSKWSFSLEGGLNKFDGDINQGLTQIFPTSFLNLTYGATLERAFTPVWGVSLDYYYFPLKASNTAPAVDIFTQLYTSDINATINFTRWIFPKSRSKFYINGSVGLGFAYYTFNVTPVTESFDTKYSVAGSVPVTFSVEYNFSKPVAIGFKAHYRVYTKDNLEGVPRLNYKGVTNDGIAAGTLYLRYKFNSVKKKHMRNMTMDFYDPDEGLVYAKVLRKDFEKLTNKVDSLEKRVDTLETDLSNVTKMPVARNVIVQKESPQPKTGETGIDNSKPTTATTYKTITSQPLTETKKIVFDSINFVSIYFDSNQFLLDKSAFSILTTIANKMIETPALKVKINGYCDDTGDIAYNNKLSRLRAEQVKERLIKTWGIASDRIVSVGRGKALAPQPNTPYRPNRRCDFFFSK